jgi:Acetyltransferase (GNAT) domain
MPQAGDLRQYEVGFTIAPDHQDRRYATEAVRLLVGYLFTVRGKHRITTYYDARNAASAALLERLGMRREGYLRESTWAKGEWTDDWCTACCVMSGSPGHRESTGPHLPVLSGRCLLLKPPATPADPQGR